METRKKRKQIIKQSFASPKQKRLRRPLALQTNTLDNVVEKETEGRDYSLTESIYHSPQSLNHSGSTILNDSLPTPVVKPWLPFKKKETGKKPNTNNDEVEWDTSEKVRMGEMFKKPSTVTKTKDKKKESEKSPRESFYHSPDSLNHTGSVILDESLATPVVKSFLPFKNKNNKKSTIDKLDVTRDSDSMDNTSSLITPKSIHTPTKTRLKQSLLFDVSYQSSITDTSLSTPELLNKILFKGKKVNKSTLFNVTRYSDADDSSLISPKVNNKVLFKKYTNDHTNEFNVSRQSTVSDVEDNTKLESPKSLPNLPFKKKSSGSVVFNVSRQSDTSVEESTFHKDNEERSLSTPTYNQPMPFQKKTDSTVPFNVSRHSSDDEDSLHEDLLVSPRAVPGILFPKAADKTVPFNVSRQSDNDGTLQNNHVDDSLVSPVDKPLMPFGKTTDNTVPFNVSRDSDSSEGDVTLTQHNNVEESLVPKSSAKMPFEKVNNNTVAFNVSRDSDTSSTDVILKEQSDLEGSLTAKSSAKMPFEKVENNTVAFNVSRQSDSSEDEGTLDGDNNVDQSLAFPRNIQVLPFRKTQNKTVSFNVSRQSDSSDNEVPLHDDKQVEDSLPSPSSRLPFNKVSNNTVPFNVSRYSSDEEMIEPPASSINIARNSLQKMAPSDSPKNDSFRTSLTTPKVTSRMPFVRRSNNTLEFNVSRHSSHDESLLLDADENIALSLSSINRANESMMSSFNDENLNLLHSFNSDQEDNDILIDNQLHELRVQCPIEHLEPDYWERKHQELVEKTVKKFTEKQNMLKGLISIRKPKKVTKDKCKTTVVHKPRRKRPASFATDRLYQYITNKLKPEFGLDAVLRAEEFVRYLADVVKIIERKKTHDPKEINKLKKEMAKLKIIFTHLDFYKFTWDYLPASFQMKVIPAYQPGSNVVWPPCDVADERENILP